MFDIMETDHKKFKNENVGRNKDLEGKIDDVARENYALKERNSELEKKCEELQVNSIFWYVHRFFSFIIFKMFILRFDIFHFIYL